VRTAPTCPGHSGWAAHDERRGRSRPAGGLGTYRRRSSRQTVTLKAISYHLSNIYAKHGLRGRRQLRQLLSEVGSGPATIDR
jgi:hypothetical protein